MSGSANAIELRPHDDPHADLDADESGEHTVLMETTRLAAFDLEKVLAMEAAIARASATTESNDDFDADPTLTVSAPEHMRLVTRAFGNTDGEITLDAPVGPLPKHVLSPLGDGRRAVDAGIDLPPGAPELPSALGSVDQRRSFESVPHLPLVAPEALAEKVSGIRPCVRPERARVLHDAHDAALVIRKEEAKTRLIVIAIWGTAVVLAGHLAFFALAP